MKAAHVNLVANLMLAIERLGSDFNVSDREHSGDPLNSCHEDLQAVRYDDESQTQKDLTKDDTRIKRLKKRFLTTYAYWERFGKQA